MATIIGVATREGVKIPLEALRARIGAAALKKVLKSLSVTEVVHKGRPGGMAPAVRRAYRLGPLDLTVPRLKAAAFLEAKAVDRIDAALFGRGQRALSAEATRPARELYSYQEAAVAYLCGTVYAGEAVAAGRGVAYLELATGLGKSAVGATVIARRGRPGLVVVPTKALSEQWIDEFKAAYPLMKAAAYSNAAKVKCSSASHDVVVIVINTFRAMPVEFLEGFGTIVIDEAHELQSTENSKALWLAQMVPAVLGLSATPADRKDGLDQFVTMMLAPVLKPADIPGFDAAAVQFKNTVRIVEYSGADAHTETVLSAAGTMSAILTVGAILKDPERLALVAREVLRLHCLHETLSAGELSAAGLGPRPAAAATKDYPEGEVRRHGVFVFAETRDFLPVLREALLSSGADISSITAPELDGAIDAGGDAGDDADDDAGADAGDVPQGGTDDVGVVSVLRGGVAKTAVGDAKKQKAHIVLTTYGFSRRGISLPDMTAIVLATPRRNGLTQILGRITRRGGDESILRVIVDIVDVRTGLKGQASDRKKVYREKGFPIEKVKVAAAAPEAETPEAETPEAAAGLGHLDTLALIGMCN